MTDSTMVVLGATAFALVVVLYVWLALALAALFRKVGEASWKGWVPVLNVATVLKLGGFSPWLVLLNLVPLFGFIAFAVVFIVAVHRINTSFGVGAGLTVVGAILPVIRAAHGVAEVLRAPTQIELVTAYRDLRPHVLHFIGHGTVLPGTGSVLQLGSGATAWTLSDQQILNILPGWVGRVAILNACRSAAGSPTESNAQTPPSLRNVTTADGGVSGGAPAGTSPAVA